MQDWSHLVRSNLHFICFWSVFPLQTKRQNHLLIQVSLPFSEDPQSIFLKKLSPICQLFSSLSTTFHVLGKEWSLWFCFVQSTITRFAKTFDCFQPLYSKLVRKVPRNLCKQVWVSISNPQTWIHQANLHCQYFSSYWERVASFQQSLPIPALLLSCLFLSLQQVTWVHSFL